MNGVARDHCISFSTNLMQLWDRDTFRCEMQVVSNAFMIIELGNGDLSQLLIKPTTCRLNELATNHWGWNHSLMKSDSWLHCLEGGLLKRARRLCQVEGSRKALALWKASEHCSQKPVGSYSGLFAAPVMMGLMQEDEVRIMFCSEGKAFSNWVSLGISNTWVKCICERCCWWSSCHLGRGCYGAR